jgi:anti-sigma-K factor RskA
MSTDVHTLSGAYALNALAPEEAAEFRQHLAGCQACRDEVRELQSAAALMGAAEALAPPPGLRARVLALADRTPQLPPPVGGVPAAGPGGPGERPGTGHGGSHRGGSPLRWLAVAAAGVVLAGLGAVGLRAVLTDDPSLAPAAVQVFEAEDARTAVVETANGGTLRVGISPSRNEMAVDTRDLPELDSEHVYQIWAVQGEEMVSAAVLEDPDTGAAMGMPAEQTQVALTIEPKGGSPQPTTEPIVQVDPYGV